MTTELHVYDFDGTLFRSPEKPGWWDGKFWWFDPQSLDEPCVPENPGSDWWIGSTVSQAKRSISDPNVWAILMTGRADRKFRWRVPELLKSKGLNFDEVHLAPGKGTTEYFKVTIVKKILARYPFIEKVRFWDDNVRNLGLFQKVVEDTGREAEVNPVKVPAHPLLCTPEQVGSMQRVAYHYLQKLARPKTACIIAVGDWDGHKCLFKNRDRNYTPEIRVYHTLIDGVEALYMKDEVTGWCEGMNEHGIGLVNAALAVYEDEKQGKGGKGKSDDPSTLNTLRDGKRVLKGLGCETLEDALQAVQNHLGGLRGHTLLADPETTYSLEATWRGHDYHIRKLPGNRKHVRTNHGQRHQDAGYTEKDGDNYLSSLARRDQAMKLLRQVDKPTEIGPAIYKKRRKDYTDPLNMIKLTDGMRTSSQMVLDLTGRTAHLYLLPDEVKFLGYKSDLPKGHETKLTLNVYEYGKLDGNGDVKVKKVKV